MIRIVGQGLAGTLLGWELERAGIPFVIHDPGHGQAASRVAAGIVNPVTGRRLVRTWRADTLLPVARSAYRELGLDLGIPCWRDMRVRRFFRDVAERRVFERRVIDGSLAPHVTEPGDSDGFWIEGAGAVDVLAVIEAARARWRECGRLVERTYDGGAPDMPTIYCTGAGLAAGRLPDAEVAKGEILTIAGSGMENGIIRNRGHWLLPAGAGTARVGATYGPGSSDATPTDSARRELRAAALALGAAAFEVTAHEAGTRVSLPDRLPVAGWLAPGEGVLGALGSKGVLHAPWLARQWRNHLSHGHAFDPAISTDRLARARNSHITTRPLSKGSGRDM